MPIFTPEQTWTFFAAVSGQRLEALYVLGLTTRMREGELLGLRWRDVDLDAARLHITSCTTPGKVLGIWTRPRQRRAGVAWISRR